MNKKVLSNLFLPIIITALTIIITPLANCSGGKNDQAKFALDLKTTNEDTQASSVIDVTPEFAAVDDIDTGAQSGILFIATLVLKGAVDLVGVNCDLVFDNSKLSVVTISETRGDVNFDGRANIADILTLSERYGASSNEKGYSYFKRDQSGQNTDVINEKDIEAVKPFINENNIFWTKNANDDLSKMRESVEIFESPAVSNKNGRIADIVSVLLSRIHPYPAGFGFSGDARIAEITFKVIGDISKGTKISFEKGIAIDVNTEITRNGINKGSEPVGDDVVITLQ